MLADITGWVRQIAIVVLLAGVVELVLPGGKTRPYVRVITGLLVMLTILDPLFSALGHRVTWAEPDVWPSELTLPSSVELPQQADMQQQTLRLTIETYRQRVADEISRIVNRVEGVETVSVAVDIENRQEDPDYGSILAVAVTVCEAQEQPRNTIEPVQPISLLVDPQGENEWPARLESARRAILQALDLNFNLDRDQIELVFVSQK